MFGWFIGEVLCTYYELVAYTDPYPSLADLFYFLSYAAFAVGLVWELKFLRTQAQRAAACAMASIGAGGHGLEWSGYLFWSLPSDRRYSWLENAVAISYGVADIGLILMGLVITVVTAEMRGGKLAQPWWWFLVALVVFL